MDTNRPTNHDTEEERTKKKSARKHLDGVLEELSRQRLDRLRPRGREQRRLPPRVRGRGANDLPDGLLEPLVQHAVRLQFLHFWCLGVVGRLSHEEESVRRGERGASVHVILFTEPPARRSPRPAPSR
jgi:hypothetical protein